MYKLSVIKGIHSGTLIMYNMVIIVKNTLLYTQELLKESI